MREPRHATIETCLAEVDQRLLRVPNDRRAARFFVAYAAFVVVAYLALFWSVGDPPPRHLPWVIAANALLLPSAFIYADLRKRRKQTAK
jgi:hypothetical protein